MKSFIYSHKNQVFTCVQAIKSGIYLCTNHKIRCLPSKQVFIYLRANYKNRYLPGYRTDLYQQRSIFHKQNAGRQSCFPQPWRFHEYQCERGRHETCPQWFPKNSKCMFLHLAMSRWLSTTSHWIPAEGISVYMKLDAGHCKQQTETVPYILYTHKLAT